MKELLERLQAGDAALGQVLPPRAAKRFPQWAARRKFSEVCRCDAAVRQWIATQQWPPLKNGDGFELALRVAAARECLQNGAAQVAVVKLPLAEALDILLIQFWHVQGLAWLRFRYSSRR